MSAVYAANALVLAIAIWAVYERRHTFGSRWDAPFTFGIIIFGLGTALDSPWPAVAAASFPLTGKFYLLNTFGHICFLAGTATGIRGIYLRLMPDDVFGRFMRLRVAPLVAVPAAIMLVCVVASPVTSTMPAAHLYRVKPDVWLAVYWVVLIGAMTALETISVYGMFHLRREPDAVGVGAQIAGVLAGGVGVALISVGAISGHIVFPVAVWLLSYLAIGGGAIAAVFMWRHRVAEITRPARGTLVEGFDLDNT